MNVAGVPTMNPPGGPRLHPFWVFLVRICAFVVMGLGSLGVLGWMLEMPILTAFRSGYVSTSLEGAFTLIVLGGVLFSTTLIAPNLLVSRFSLVGAGIICMMGLLGAGGALTTIVMLRTPEEALIAPTSVPTILVAPRSLISSLLLFCSGLAAFFLLLQRLIKTVPFLAGIVGGTSWVVLLGYIYGTPILYGGRLRPVGIATALAFLTFAVGALLAAGPRPFPTRLLVGPTVSARMLRTFVPITFFVVFSNQILSDFLRWRAFQNPALRDALMAAISTLVVTVAVIQVARVIGRAVDEAQAARERLESELQEAHRALERRVDQRTMELAEVNAHLKSEIIERIKMEKALVESQTKTRALLDTVPDWVLQISSDGTVVDGNVSRSDKALLFDEYVIGRSIRSVWPEPLAEKTMFFVVQTIQTRASHVFEFQFERGDHRFFFEARMVASGGDKVLAVLRDFTEKKRLEREILEISTEEQQRIGKDLHDGLGQHLTGLAFRARAFEERISKVYPAEASEAHEIRQLAISALSQARMLARGLFPVELESKGLGPALQELAYNVVKIYKIPCEVDWDPEVEVQDKDAEKHLYRITQEAINNAVKHAEASQINVQVYSEGDFVIFSVRDNGSGIPKEALGSQGMGLRTMHYRARKIGGHLKIEANPDGGTTVTCAVPKPNVQT